MATKFYNVAKAAEVLGVSPDDINAMRERQELHGYRDGADWKFKAEEVDALVGQIAAAPSNDLDDLEGDVLLSEVELGESDPGASGTIIGPPPKDALEETEGLGSSVSGFEDLHLSLDDSQLDIEIASATSGMSGLELAGDEVDDEDLVLGGSGSGSDITIGGDSGISLIDPTDSGLSLEEPLDLAGSSESLELGEDDLFSLEEGSSILSPSDLGTTDDFTLTPMDDSADEEESGSQVIALDVEQDSDALGVAPMLDGDLAGELEAIGPAPLGSLSAGVAARSVGDDFGAAAGQSAAAGAAAGVLPETPYTGWNIFFLVLCVIILTLIGMMMYDLVRNMWSWNQPYPVNSWLMDMILGRS
ncbi:MAG: helix-turn-helix domain-containing protein [Pirellulales bacterium]|nr:helix-turn-helix domain-containing protein [Pirellulales bacterium]